MKRVRKIITPVNRNQKSVFKPAPNEHLCQKVHPYPSRKRRAPGSAFHSIPDSVRPQYHQPAEMMTDLEYAKFMEESYGILDEGAF
jgi:hypothetical protein